MYLGYTTVEFPENVNHKNAFEFYEETFIQEVIPYEESIASIKFLKNEHSVG